MVTRKDRKDLEGKLLAIQDLKREKYIGTQEAWNYIERVNALYENPIKIANTINEELRKKGTIYYPATPERIVGLYHSLGDLLTDWIIDEDNPPDYVHNLSFEILQLNDYLVGGQISRSWLGKDYLKTFSNYLIPIFQDVQYHGSTNQDFVNSAVKLLLINAPDNLKKTFFSKVNQNLNNWDYLLSKKNLREVEGLKKESIYFEEISIYSRVSRFEKDFVGHRLENRREILADWINKHRDVLKTEGFEYIIEKKKERFQRLYKQLSTLTRSDAHTELLDKYISLIHGAEFILRCLASERRFAEKYLES